MRPGAKIRGLLVRTRNNCYNFYENILFAGYRYIDVLVLAAVRASCFEDLVETSLFDNAES